MPAAESNQPIPPETPATSGPFATTHWSQVMAAAGAGRSGREREAENSTAAGAALTALCETYWYPLYAYLRRSGETRERAEDLTQEFFATRVVTGRIFEGISPAGGRFRSWLLTSLQHLVANVREKEHAAKRGGGRPHLSLDFQAAEDRYASEPGLVAPTSALAVEWTPERLYERSWALRLLEVTMGQLAAEHRAAGKSAVFEELRGFLPGEHSGRSHAEVAERLGMSADAVKMAVHRLRQEFGRRLRAEVRRLSGRPEDVEDELRALLSVLSGG